MTTVTAIRVTCDSACERPFQATPVVTLFSSPSPTGSAYAAPSCAVMAPSSSQSPRARSKGPQPGQRCPSHPARNDAARGDCASSIGPMAFGEPSDTYPAGLTPRETEVLE